MSNFRIFRVRVQIEQTAGLTVIRLSLTAAGSSSNCVEEDSGESMAGSETVCMATDWVSKSRGVVKNASK